MSAQLFIVEDEAELAALVADYARAAGYVATVFDDGAAALAAIRATPPDLVVLDLMLPGLDGLAVCRAVRAFSELPIIMVTARVEEIDRLIGLESGADDYLCKPFSPRELIARIHAILRRTRAYAGGGVGAGASAGANAGADASTHASAGADARATPHAAERVIVVDDAGRRIHANGTLLDLTPSEFAILAGMARRRGQVFARAQLLDLARGDSLDVTDRAVDSHIKNLRRKLAAALPGAEPIASIYGLGYRLDV